MERCSPILPEESISSFPNLFVFKLQKNSYFSELVTHWSFEIFWSPKIASSSGFEGFFLNVIFNFSIWYPPNLIIFNEFSWTITFIHSSPWDILFILRDLRIISVIITLAVDWCKIACANEISSSNSWSSVGSLLYLVFR